jgi:hypothetical protein
LGKGRGMGKGKGKEMNYARCLLKISILNKEDLWYQNPFKKLEEVIYETQMHLEYK